MLILTFVYEDQRQSTVYINTASFGLFVFFTRFFFDVNISKKLN